MVRWSPLVIAAAIACAPEEVPPEVEDTGDGNPGESECGTPVRGISMTFVGAVTDADQLAVSDATVRLEDRVAPRRTLASTTTDESGSFSLATDDITHWPGCWLVAVDYWLVVTAGEQTGERHVALQIEEAIQSDAVTVDLRDEAITLYR